ncbi:Imm30 family immunity protein [Acetivibrio clariflavus]|uniref:Imm30 family immunity protein n=1 Tax=Acetivibrio clariflavus TaxID=288965 RepID=UPI000483DB9C|nr:Imm30 family immunity protein [Acetivibrio clariflavus]
MDVNTYIKDLQKNKLLRTQEECEAFDNALEKLSNYQSKEILEDLFLVFDDSAKEEEVMFGLIHFLEDYEMNTYLNGLAKSLPKMLQNAKEWVLILNKRILNSEQYRNAYAEIIKVMEEQYKKLIINLMNEIKLDNPKKFESLVNDFISKIG